MKEQNQAKPTCLTRKELRNASSDHMKKIKVSKGGSLTPGASTHYPHTNL